MVASRESPELLVNPRNKFLRQVTCPRAHCRGVDVLVSTQSSKPIRHDDDRRFHFTGTDKSIETLRKVFGETVPIERFQTAGSIGSQINQNRIAILLLPVSRRSDGDFSCGNRPVDCPTAV